MLYLLASLIIVVALVLLATVRLGLIGRRRIILYREMGREGEREIGMGRSEETRESRNRRGNAAREEEGGRGEEGYVVSCKYEEACEPGLGRHDMTASHLPTLPHNAL